MTELLRLLVYEFRMVSYDYFCDQMQPYEVANLIDCIPYTDRPQWEQTRLKIFSTASMFSKGSMTVKDIMQFPWESDDGAETEPMTQEITGGDIERLKQQAKLFINSQQNNGTGL